MSADFERLVEAVTRDFHRLPMVGINESQRRVLAVQAVRAMLRELQIDGCECVGTARCVTHFLAELDRNNDSQERPYDPWNEGIG